MNPPAPLVLQAYESTAQSPELPPPRPYNNNIASKGLPPTPRTPTSPCLSPSPLSREYSVSPPSTPPRHNSYASTSDCEWVLVDVEVSAFEKKEVEGRWMFSFSISRNTLRHGTTIIDQPYVVWKKWEHLIELREAIVNNNNELDHVLPKLTKGNMFTIANKSTSTTRHKELVSFFSTLHKCARDVMNSTSMKRTFAKEPSSEDVEHMEDERFDRPLSNDGASHQPRSIQTKVSEPTLSQLALREASLGRMQSVDDFQSRVQRQRSNVAGLGLLPETFENRQDSIGKRSGITRSTSEMGPEMGRTQRSQTLQNPPSFLAHEGNQPRPSALGYSSARPSLPNLRASDRAGVGLAISSPDYFDSINHPIYDGDMSNSSRRRVVSSGRTPLSPSTRLQHSPTYSDVSTSSSSPSSSQRSTRTGVSLSARSTDSLTSLDSSTTTSHSLHSPKLPVTPPYLGSTFYTETNDSAFGKYIFDGQGRWVINNTLPPTPFFPLPPTSSSSLAGQEIGSVMTGAAGAAATAKRKELLLLRSRSASNLKSLSSFSSSSSLAYLSGMGRLELEPISASPEFNLVETFESFTSSWIPSSESMKTINEFVHVKVRQVDCNIAIKVCRSISFSNVVVKILKKFGEGGIKIDREDLKLVHGNEVVVDEVVWKKLVSDCEKIVLQVV